MEPDEFGAAQQRLADYVRRVGDVQRRAEETQAQIKTMRAHVSSPDRSVSVVLAPGGRLERLTLTQQAMQFGPDRLASLITETMRNAHNAAAEQMQAVLQPLVGDSPAMEFLRDQIGAAQQDDPADVAAQQDTAGRQNAPQQRRRSARDDDDDEPFGSVLR